MLAVALTGLLLAGCTAPVEGSDSTAPTPSASVATPTSTPSAEPTTPAAPQLVPGGSASANLPVFTSVVDAVWASPDSVTGRAYIDALVATGFDKSAMQLTPDTTTVGNPAETIQFSVLVGEECLVGQVGPATGTAVTAVLPALGGSCLVGATRAIDW